MRVMTLYLFLPVLLLGVTAVHASAQGLADISRKEEARRQAVAQPGKVYTNRDLRPDITSSAPDAAPPAQVPEVSPSTATGADVPAPAKDQAYWAGRIGDARAALDRSRLFADGLQSRLNALAADIVNRDDPIQRAQLEIERQRAGTELDRVNREIGEQIQAIADIEEEARKAGVPAGWLR
jgi:hypothetical protein